jgi:signal recognition particle subunit SRP54
LNPIETLFVVDAMQGQDAVNTARAFGDALPLTGVVLTKLDGDARGGAALSVRHITGKPLKFVGVSEKLDGLEPFHPERMAQRVLGMGDIVSLVEQAQKNIDMADAQKLAAKMKSGDKFDLNDFRDQLAQVKKMGDMGSLLEKLPAQFAQAAGQLQNGQADKQLRRTEGILNSMTPQERADLRKKVRNYALSEFSYQKTIDDWHDTSINLIKTWKEKRKNWEVTSI